MVKTLLSRKLKNTPKYKKKKKNESYPWPCYIKTYISG